MQKWLHVSEFLGGWAKFFSLGLILEGGWKLEDAMVAILDNMILNNLAKFKLDLFL